MRIPLCEFHSLDDLFNFGRYKGLSLADVLDLNPSYVCWCVKHCTGVVIRLFEEVINQIQVAYPSFQMDALFESKRIDNLSRSSYIELDNLEEECDWWDSDNEWFESYTYERHRGSWAQDVEGFSDNDIDIIFEGDPTAYWNID